MDNILMLAENLRVMRRKGVFNPTAVTVLIEDIRHQGLRLECEIVKWLKDDN
jgi:hypothetical protein